jgi:hypothetical protein
MLCVVLVLMSSMLRHDHSQVLPLCIVMLHYNVFLECPNNVGVQVKEVCIFFSLFFH